MAEEFEMSELPYRWFAQLGIAALTPLQNVLPNIFERLCWRVVQKPVMTCHKFVALLILVISPVLLTLSLVSCLLAYLVKYSGRFIIKLLGMTVFRIEGLNYAVNLTLFGQFNHKPACDCEILALVRKETGKSEKDGSAMLSVISGLEALLLDEVAYGSGHSVCEWRGLLRHVPNPHAFIFN